MPFVFPGGAPRKGAMRQVPIIREKKPRMDNLRKTGIALTIAALAVSLSLLTVPVSVRAPSGPDPIAVFVGYADNLRSSPFFPVPWAGDPNVIFIGGGTFDAGAIRIDNTGGSPVTIDSVSVLLHGPGSTVPFGNPPGPVNLWGTGIVVPAGFHLILTQTVSFNFDTSDNPISGCGSPVPNGTTPLPEITVTIAGVPHQFNDTAHVLDTGGFDLACLGNESLQWRPIGTCGVSCPGGGSISVSKFFTDTSLNPLPLDKNGNPKVDVVLAGGIVRSTNPGEIIAWVNVTNSGGVSVDSVKLNETLPVDWVVAPTWLPAKGAIHVFYANTTSLATNPEITDPSTITVSTGNPETVGLAIPDLSATAIGHPLQQGQSILLGVKLDYGLDKTSQSASSFPRNYTDTASGAAWTGASFTGAEFSASGSAFFIAYAKLLGDVNGDNKIDIVDVATIAYAYNTSPGNARWNTNADLDNNGVVNIMDVAIVAFYYGTSL